MLVSFVFDFNPYTTQNYYFPQAGLENHWSRIRFARFQKRGLGKSLVAGTSFANAAAKGGEKNGYDRDDDCARCGRAFQLN